MLAVQIESLGCNDPYGSASFDLRCKQLLLFVIILYELISKHKKDIS